MHAFPHVYPAEASADAVGPIVVSSRHLPSLVSAAPAEFDGPGDQWSPETLLVAAVADCFVLTFRAVARAARLEWTHLECHADGTLDRSPGDVAAGEPASQAAQSRREEPHASESGYMRPAEPAGRSELAGPRKDSRARFTEIHLHVKLVLARCEDAPRARTLLEKAERGCLISNSLSAKVTLDSEVLTDGTAECAGAAAGA